VSASAADAAIVERALAYPFPAPDGSYELRDGEARPLPGGPLPAGRIALLAFGANASPARLVEKLGPAARLPVLAGRLRGFDVAYSAHVSLYGSIPGALVRSPGTTIPVHVLLPDDEQLAVLDASERNYDRRTLRSVALTLEDGGPLHAVDAYVSRHGALRVDGTALALSALAAEERALPAADEARALERARDRVAPGVGLAEFVLGHAGRPEVARERTAVLRADAVPAGI
jgi:hypothetical protein